MAEVEQWHPVVGYEGLYEVSDQGRVRSLDRLVRRSNQYGAEGSFMWRGRILKSTWSPSTGKYRTGKTGYFVVALSDGERREQRRVHRLVLLAFVGPAPDGYEAAHEDGNFANNALRNLSWKTAKGNSADRIRHGRQSHKPTWIKLKPADVRAIRAAVAAGATQKSQCDKYGLSSGYVCSLVHPERHYANGVTV